MRKTIVPAIAIAAVIAVAAGGCAAASTGPGGAWTGCGNVARATAVQVRRLAWAGRPGWVALPLPPARPSAAAVRRLFGDFCVIVGHPDVPSGGPGSCACPSISVRYRGVFYAGRRRLATFAYDAMALWLQIGPQQTQTTLLGTAATAEPASLGTDLAAVLGIPPGTVYNPKLRHRSA